MPTAIDFFPAGKEPRAEQRQAIAAIERSFADGRNVVAFQGPTGSGKSYVGMSFAKLAESVQQKTHLITVQKVLQDQYHADFKPPEIEVMKGRTNYKCDYEPWENRNASKGYCRRVAKAAIIPECLKFGTVEQAAKMELPPEAHSCSYWAQLMRSIRSPITLFNFQSFLFQQRLGRFGRRDLLILDECHNAENILMQFVELTLSDKVLKHLGVRLDLRLQTGKDVLAWLDRERVVEKVVEQLGSAARGEAVAGGLTPGENDQLQGLLAKIEDLRKYLDLTEWVVDVTEDADPDDHTDKTRKLRVRPVFVSLFAKELIFSKAARTLAMSATILDPKIWARNLGIRQSDYGFVEVPCLFPTSNRPIFLEYAGNMNFQSLEDTLPRLWPILARILDRHRGQRGIIHAHSERLCKAILENVRSPRFLHLDMFKGRDKTALLREHMRRPDAVIVASAMHEGVDLKDDAARFQVIAKIPWPSTEDKLVKVRMQHDGSFLPYNAALKFIQSYGRPVRHKDDWAATYITDQGYETFEKKCGWLLPKWFTAAVQRKAP